MDSAEIDVGKCPEGKCTNGSGTSFECSEHEPYFCCAPSESIIIEVNCSSTFPIFDIVTACGCQLSPKPKTYIRGTVIASGSNEPVSETEIYVDGIYILSTTDDGKFNLSVDGKSERITVSVNVPFDSDYVSTAKTVYLEQDAKRIYYITITLVLRPNPIEFDSVEGTESAIMPPSGAILGNVIIPPNSIYDSDGNLYKVCSYYMKY